MFSAEVIMHRYLLQSRARTLDPARAGLFFTPAYSSCKLTLKKPRVEGKAPTNPHIKQQVFIRDVLAYLRKQPAAMARWWRRYAGLDHVFMFTHDFGGCLDYRDHGHGIPSLIREHARHVIFAQPNGEFTSSCFNPHKDLVIPPVSTLVLSQLELGQQLPLGHSSMRSSPHLIYFRGTVEWDWLGQPDPKYSRGVRQAIFSLYGSPESRANFPQFRLHSGSAPQAQYLNELQSATFCLCPLGYATWSPRLVDAIVTGCIPVIIADDTRPPFTDILDYSRFSIAITEKEAVFPGRLQELLSRISADQVQQMQAELARPSVWRPFVFAPKPADCGACEALVDSLWRHRTRLGV